MRVEIYEPWEWGARLARVVHGADDSAGARGWLEAQRSASRRGLLQDSQLKLAAASGLRVRKDDGEFERACSAWKAFQGVHGSAAMPAADSALGAYLRRQRRLQRKGRLSVDRVARLDSLGMPWRLSEVVTRDELAFHRTLVRLDQHSSKSGARAVSYDQVGLGRCPREIYDLAYAMVYAARFGLLSRERMVKLARFGLQVARPEDGEFSVWRVVPRAAA